jgi:hypothetical protein
MSSNRCECCDLWYCDIQRAARDAEMMMECSGEDLSRLAEEWYPELLTSEERVARVEADEAYDKMCGYEPAEGPGKPNLRPSRVPLKALPLERTRAGYKALAVSKKKQLIRGVRKAGRKAPVADVE